MQILLTGATGFLGSQILEMLLSHGFAVRALLRDPSKLSPRENLEIVEGNLSDIVSLSEALQSIDLVIHTAAVVAFNKAARDEMYRTNHIGTANLVNACLMQSNKPKLIHISSVSVFGISKESQVISESNGWLSDNNATHYGKSKYWSELEVWRGQEEGLEIVILNPSVILGEGNWHKDSNAILKYVVDGNPFYTTGNINFVDVKDVVQAVHKLLNMSTLPGRRFIISGGNFNFKDFFTEVATAYKVKPPAYSLPKWLSEIGWRAYAILGLITGKPQLVTKETTKTAFRRAIFNPQCSKDQLDIRYTPLKETLARLSGYYSNR